MRFGSIPASPSIPNINATNERQWLAVRTAPRHEKKVAFHCAQRSVDHFIPLWRVHRRWSDGSKVEVDLPLFPGYLFVRIDPISRTPILRIPGVLYFVTGTAREPAPLPEAQIEALRLGLPMRRAEPHRLLTEGQRVRIRSGALAGMEGIFLRTGNGARVVVTLDLLMQSIAIEVHLSEIEPIGSSPFAT